MDLAKIRQKARKELESQKREEPLPRHAEQPVSGTLRDHTCAYRNSAEGDIFSAPEPAELITTFQGEVLQNDEVFSRRIHKDPLEAILAGRRAAGCHHTESDAVKENSGGQIDEFRDFLCFRVSNEVYGLDIMDIKELIRPRDVTEIPRAPSFVSGVISLRGIIIPIIDMRDRLGLPPETSTGRERVIVIRRDDSFSGLLVDEIMQVLRVASDCIEAPPTVLEGIDRDFVSGIGRADGRMIILLNLESISDIERERT
jgi:purine-binding chemotaxis protein CheW